MTGIFTGDWMSKFGRDQDGNSFSLTKLSVDPLSIALQKLLPGDELVTLENGHIVTWKVRDAHPLGMTASDEMTWKKNLEVKRKRRVKNAKAYWREVMSGVGVGTRFHAHPRTDYENQLIELTHEDGHKTFLVGIMHVVRMEKSN